MIIKNNMANLITFSRILIGISLLFVPFFLNTFYILYSIGILTDIIDGLVARITHSTTEYGSKLDTIADIVFTILCLMLFLINIKLSLVIYILATVTLIIKLTTIERYFRIYRKFYSNHSILNKITGLILSLIPYLLFVGDVEITLLLIGCLSIFNAIVEHLTLINIDEKALMDGTKI